MLFYTHIHGERIATNKLINISVTSHSYHLCVFVSLCVGEYLRYTLLANFKLWYSITYDRHGADRCIWRIYSSSITETLHTLTNISPFSFWTLRYPLFYFILGFYKFSCFRFYMSVKSCFHFFFDHFTSLKHVVLHIHPCCYKFIDARISYFLKTD